MSRVLIVYYSRHGSVARLATQIANGVESENDCEAILRCVPEISANSEQTQPSVPDSGPPYASIDDLKNCDALIIGSPAYFGNMAAPLKYFLDQSTPLWLSGALIGKPAGVFTSSSSMHGGQESVLLNMMLPLLHQGMLITGIPYAESSIHNTQSGGSPYGASHVSSEENSELTSDESASARALGKRIAQLAHTLSS